MRKNSLLQFIFFTLVILVFFSCKKDDGDNDNNEENRIKSIVTMNVNDPEIFKIITEKDDTITWYGSKNENGTAKKLENIEVKNPSGTTLLEFNDNQKVSSIYCNHVNFEFEWIDDVNVIIKTHDLETNDYISTLCNINEVNQSSQNLHLNTNELFHTSRSGKLKLEQKVFKSNNLSTQATTRANGVIQKCLLTMTRCDSPINGTAWIEMHSISGQKVLGRIYKHDVLSPGNYLYVIPSSVYPTASNQEMLANIDLLISVGAVGTQWLADGALAFALTSASTIVGEIPAGIAAALGIINLVASGVLTYIDSVGGLSTFVQNVNPEWYNKEYINGDIIVYPVVQALPHDEIGMSEIVNYEQEYVYLTVNLDGEPTISSFNLTPSYPLEGQDYQAIADFTCIPYGSTISISIVGTDGYTDSITQNVIAPTGQAILHVPGAESGVYDVCNVVITTPNEQVYSMRASLVFQ